eukprot:TRINITY_DN14351_c1_g1_i1.p1 TRINITY_DN14351_c1_g1~~TRINITY_DN14351_c1_g1_i1.p1  ORF type:complete len:406 (-),score=64.59 TRINITY_DN14351_c1_g1_i1:186-1403(-)
MDSDKPPCKDEQRVERKDFALRLLREGGGSSEPPTIFDTLRESDPSSTPVQTRLGFARELARGLALSAIDACIAPNDGSRPVYVFYTQPYEALFSLMGEALAEAQLYFTVGLPGIPEFFVSHCWSPPQGLTWCLPRDGGSGEDQATYDWMKAVQLRHLLEEDAQREVLAKQKANEEVVLWLDKVSSPQIGEAFELCKSYGFFFSEYLALCPRMLVLATPQYFSRLWCLYEFAAFLVLHSTANVYVGISVFLHCGAPIEAYIDSIKSISVANANCHVPSDRTFLLGLIEENYVSLDAFERYAKLAAVAVIGRNLMQDSSIHYPAIVNLAGELGFSDLQSHLAAMTLPRKGGRGYDRSLVLYKARTKFDNSPIPALLNEERKLALRPDAALLRLCPSKVDDDKTITI